MSEIGDKIDLVVSQGLHPELKRDGFRKHGRTFKKQGENLWQMVQVQGSMFNTDNDGRFTINYGVHLPCLVSAGRLSHKHSPPGILDCTIGGRIGQLMPDGEDVWWRVDAAIDLSAVAQDIATAWTRYGRPWMARYDNLVAIRDLLIGRKSGSWHDPFDAAAISVELRDLKAAEALLREVIKFPGIPIRSISSWASSIGVSLS